MQGSIDQACLELAAAEPWLITRDQALKLGLSRHALDRRKRSGLLVPMFAGIYRVALPLNRGRNTCSRLACGFQERPRTGAHLGSSGSRATRGRSSRQ